jgi:hypothetical protein
MARDDHPQGVGFARFLFGGLSLLDHCVGVSFGS